MGALHRPLLLIAVCLGTAYSIGCPTECTCSRVQQQYLVDCSGRGLSSIPDLPIETDELDLSGNSIEVLQDGSFTSATVLKRLDLSSNGLSQLQLNAFQDMPNLKTLNLSRNSLKADNFRDHELMRGCRHITELDLSYNKLTKIPDSGLKVLTKLEKLYLSNNALTSPVFGPGFQSLEVIELVDISHNDFSEIPSEAFNVIDIIQTINLSNCDIRTVQTGAFEDLRRLTHFDISNNQRINQRDLNATIKAVCNSVYLSSLRLSNVNISDLSYVLTPLLETDNMSYLDLSHNSLRTLDVADLRPAKKLRYLNLSHNKLARIPSLGQPLLQNIDLSYNFISDLSKTPFETCSELKEITLSHNRLREFPSGTFSANTFLKKLDVSYNEIQEVPTIDGLEVLEELSAQGNLIIDPTSFFMIYELKTLDLGSNQIDHITREMLSYGSEIITLNLTRNQIREIERDTFKKWCPPILDLSYNQLRSLGTWGLNLVKDLYLQQNLLDEIRADEIEKLSFVETLDLSGNDINTLPTTLLLQLEDLQHLNLANNNLRSYFQGTMGKQMLSQNNILESLTLASNNLNMIQPQLFSNLARLKHLDLSQNQIHDVMSGQLQDLSVLQSLNLSSNNLNGFNHSIVVPLVSLETLDLTGTQWQCDCSIAEVKKWMESTDVDIVGYETYRCSGPQSNVNTFLKDYNTEEGSCSTTVMEKTVILIIIGCTSFVILVVAAIIFWQHRWRLKKKLKKQHYRAMYERAQMPLPNNNDTAIAQTEYHPHPHLHHSHTHTPNLSQKIMCPEHNHSGQAFV